MAVHIENLYFKYKLVIKHWLGSVENFFINVRLDWMGRMRFSQVWAYQTSSIMHKSQPRGSLKLAGRGSRLLGSHWSQNVLFNLQNRSYYWEYLGWITYRRFCLWMPAPLWLYPAVSPVSPSAASAPGLLDGHLRLAGWNEKPWNI